MVEARQFRVPVANHSLHLVEFGPSNGRPVLFLHGWPETWRSFSRVGNLAATEGYRAMALDLPGIGGSTGPQTGGEKHVIAEIVHDLVTELGLDNLVLVGHDAGGMVTYAYLRRYSDLAAAVIMDVVIPGIPPWESVLRNPYIWHFAFHSIPDLPETMVFKREAEYFDYFYKVISAHPDRIRTEDRDAYVTAYQRPGALTAGFDWYRAFAKDAARNSADTSTVSTPLLYLRGESEGGNVDEYRDGLLGAGIADVTTGLIPESGHFPAEENPDAVWSAIARFLGRP